MSSATTTKSKPALQAAGHSGVTQSELGDIFFKPSDLGEVEFYKTVAADHPELQEVIPVFYGLLTEGNQIKTDGEISPEQLVAAAVSAEPKEAPAPADGSAPAKKKKEHVLALKNSLLGFEEPCILDIKLGHILWDDNAAQEKRDRLDAVARSTTSGSLDMRLTGMNVYYDDSHTSKTATGERVDFGKNYGRTLDAETFATGLAKYFVRDPAATNALSPAQKRYYEYALLYFSNRLERVSELLAQKNFVMRGASVLMVYEGLASAVEDKLNKLEKAQELERQAKDEDEEDDEDDEAETAQDIQDSLFKLDLIDFAHTKFLTPEEGPDKDVLRGLSILTDVFKGYSANLGKW